MYFFVRGTVVRHLYSMTFGILIQLYIFGDDIFHVVLMSAVPYLMMCCMKRDVQQRYVTAWVLLYLSYNHI